MQPNETPVEGAPDVPVGEQLLTHNARLGLVLFALYLALYAGFVTLSALAPGVMSRKLEAVGGVNVSVAYGMLLIFAAFFMALVYMALCKREITSEGTK